MAHLIANGTPAKGTQPTVGCSTSVTLFDTLDNGQGLGEVIQQRSVFIELWDIGMRPLCLTIHHKVHPPLPLEHDQHLFS